MIGTHADRKKSPAAAGLFLRGMKQSNIEFGLPKNIDPRMTS
jgi:hypothetical protein